MSMERKPHRAEGDRLKTAYLSLWVSTCSAHVAIQKVEGVTAGICHRTWLIAVLLI